MVVYISELSKCPWGSQDLNSSVNLELGETELFPAVRTSDIPWIKGCIAKNIDINDVDIFGRNVLQSALDRGQLSLTACQALIQLGIDLKHRDQFGVTAIANVVFFYKDSFRPHQKNDRSLALFGLMLKAGVDIDGIFTMGIYQFDLREKIRSHPEMEGMIQNQTILPQGKYGAPVPCHRIRPPL